MNPLSKLRQVKVNGDVVYEVWEKVYISGMNFTKQPKSLVSRVYVTAEKFLNNKKEYFETKELAMKVSFKKYKKEIEKEIKDEKRRVRRRVKDLNYLVKFYNKYYR